MSAPPPAQVDPAMLVSEKEEENYSLFIFISTKFSL